MKKNKQQASLFSRGDTVAMFMIFAAVLMIALFGSYKSIAPDSKRPAMSAEPCHTPEIIVSELPYYDLVVAASEKYGVEVARIYATIRVESNFKPKAVSPAGARGLMQMLPSTYEGVCKDLGLEYDPDDLFDPIVNIDVCTYYLRKQYNRLGIWDNAHAAYHAGYQTVKAWLENPEYVTDGRLTNIPRSSTKSYVEKINRFYGEYSDAINN